MSLDMTVGTRVADTFVDEADAAVSQEAALARRLLLQNLLVIAGTTFGVVFTSALSVALFLR
jgi:hypothetical protein